MVPDAPVVNPGIGGDTMVGVLGRLDTAVNAPRPVFPLIGTNDLAPGLPVAPTAGMPASTLLRVRAWLVAHRLTIAVSGGALHQRMRQPPRRQRTQPYTEAWTETKLIYERIVVRGPEFVGARLTPEAYSLGLALALPERVQPAQDWVLPRPTGVKPTRTQSGLKSIPIEGADDWEVATMHSA